MAGIMHPGGARSTAVAAVKTIAAVSMESEVAEEQAVGG
jgi:hypothetical protein